MRKQGIPNRNKKYLLKRLQEMYGEDFDPIMKMAEGADALQREIEGSEQPDPAMVHAAIGAWEKVAQYTEPKMKPQAPCVEFDFDSSSPANQVASILRAAANGEISPETALMFANSVKAVVDIEAATELKARIEKLEAMLDAKSD
jgi:hypothetical protein